MSAATVDNGCTGLCCAAFHLPYTLDELRAGVNPKRPESKLVDAEQIAGMVIEITAEEAELRLFEFGGDDVTMRVNPDDDDGRFYTCRNWDEATRLCTIYEDRPAMCRDFPYGEPCPHSASCRCAGEPRQINRERHVRRAMESRNRLPMLVGPAQVRP